MSYSLTLQVLPLIFFLCFGVLFFAYLGYAVLLYLLMPFRKKKQPASPVSDPLPAVSLIVAAYNEASCIAAKCTNSLEIDYPRHLLEIIIVTDGSTDGTELIVGSYPGIILLHNPERKGKTNALNRAVTHASAEMLIFTDANAILNAGCIREIIKYYSDPAVGGVSGEKKVAISARSDGRSGEGLYWKYESFLKRTDSAWKTIVGAAGELFSLRRRLYSFLPDDTILDDFVQSLQLCLKGYDVVYEPAAFAIEPPSLNIKDEFNRKVRIAAGGFQAMKRLPSLFNVFRRPSLSFLFISHRVLRWALCPVALFILIPTNILLVLFNPEPVYLVTMILQSLFYLLALIGMRIYSRSILLYAPFYFVMMNVAALTGFIIFLRKKQTVLWAKAGRPGMA